MKDYSMIKHFPDHNGKREAFGNKIIVLLPPIRIHKRNIVKIMILYFSGTGNSLSIARQLAEKLNEEVISLTEAVSRDLSQEKTVGFVYPSYWFNAPHAVIQLVKRLHLATDAYTFIVISCGAQAGNSIWNIERILRTKGIQLSYSQKIRVPDNSAIGFGRNPNDQKWKFERYAPRLNKIAHEISIGTRNLHYAWWGPIGAFCALPSIQRHTLPMLTPSVNADKCTGCNICTKVCPQKNITMEEGKAICGSNCTQCLACIHFCPWQAVELNHKSTLKEHQYHHPKVNLEDLLHRQ